MSNLTYSLLRESRKYIDGTLKLSEIIERTPETGRKQLSAILQLLAKYDIVQSADFDEAVGSTAPFSSHDSSRNFVEKLARCQISILTDGNSELALAIETAAKKFGIPVKMITELNSGKHQAVNANSEPASPSPHLEEEPYPILIEVMDRLTHTVYKDDETSGPIGNGQYLLTSIFTSGGATWVSEPYIADRWEQSYMPDMAARLRISGGTVVQSESSVPPTTVGSTIEEILIANYVVNLSVQNSDSTIRPNVKISRMAIREYPGSNHASQRHLLTKVTKDDHFDNEPVRLAYPDESVRTQRRSESDFSRASAKLIDTALGEFTPVTEGEFTQYPLHIATCTVRRHVRGNLLASEEVRVVGAGLFFDTARYSCAMNAISICAAELKFSEHRLDRTNRIGRHKIDALDLAAEQVVSRPIDELLETQRGMAHWRTAYGVHSALSWTEAVAGGLIQNVVRLANLSDSSLIQNDAHMPLSNDADLYGMISSFCLEMLSALKLSPTMTVVPTKLSLYLVQCRVANEVSIGCGFDLAEAVDEGLQRLLLGIQSNLHREPECHPRAFQHNLSPLDIGDVDTKDLEKIEATTKCVSRELKSLGHEALVIPLEESPALSAAATSVLVRVLDTREAAIVK
ncbi:UNVERIFIED_ORG: hypothetical protein M2328_006768 [Rhodococcus erythropolis]